MRLQLGGHRSDGGIPPPETQPLLLLLIDAALFASGAEDLQPINNKKTPPPASTLRSLEEPRETLPGGGGFEASRRAGIRLEAAAAAGVRGRFTRRLNIHQLHPLNRAMIN